MMLATRAPGLLRALAVQPMQTQRAKQVVSSKLGSGSDCFQRTLFTRTEERVKQGAPPFEELMGPQLRELGPKPDDGKLTRAKDLGRWLEEVLRHKKVEVAVVSRQGSEYAKLFDPTGMTHSGIAVRDPNGETYTIYNLINHVHGNPSQGIAPQAAVWKSTPLDFFWEKERGTRDALVMFPFEELQQKMLQGIKSGEYKKLYFTSDYNIVSKPHTSDSLNCNKWVLMNLTAAKMNNYDPVAVLNAIKTNFKPGVVDVPPVVRPVINRKSRFIPPHGVPRRGPIQTVSVKSLYDSDWFPDDGKIFYNARELPPPPTTEPSLALKTCSRIALGGRLLGVALKEHLLKRGVLKDRRIGH
jgi:hypothetical protein